MNNARLTPREKQVVVGIADGYTNKQIGCLLGISIKTVERHRQQAMNKTGLHNTALITKMAIQTGLVTC